LKSITNIFLVLLWIILIFIGIRKIYCGVN
jgi:hypothetical protein